jgi:transposase InsO family protein
MPWEVRTEMSQKERFIELVQEGNDTFTNLCKQFNISRTTGYKWINRVEKEGVKGLLSQSKRPHNCPHKTSSETEQLILSIREKYSCWGGVKIHKYLSETGINNLPSSTTIQTILKRHGCITEEESRKHKPYIRFEHDNPNDLWQMDFKGHFKTQDGIPCHPLTLLDDHSRFSLLTKACLNERTDTVKQALIELFRKYGLPEKMTMDNGAPWGFSGSQLHTTLTAWLIRIGITVYHSRPLHPQTQGKLERFHRTLKKELLSRYYFNDCMHAQEGFDDWRHTYNNIRPHQGINMGRPANRYYVSKRKYPEVLATAEYPSDMDIRRVQMDGIIYYKNKRYRVGSAFRGSNIGLKPGVENNDMMDVCFFHQKVVKIDLQVPLE